AVAPEHVAVGTTPVRSAQVRSLAEAADKTYVVWLYHNLLHRAPKPGAVACWVQALESGASRRGVEATLLASPEYQRLHKSTHVTPPSHTEGTSTNLDSATGIPTTNPGGGPDPSGYLYGS